MTRFLAIGLALLLCVVAAGIGGYIAMRTNATAVSAPESGVSLSSPNPGAGATGSVARASSTEGVVGDPPAATASQAAARPQTSAGVPPPAPSPARATNSRKKPARPTAVAGSDIGAASSSAQPRASVPRQPPPAVTSAEPPQTGGWNGVARPSPTENAASPMQPTAPLPAPVPPAPPEPPAKQFEELVVSADSVLGLQIDTTITTARARVEDPVEARITRDVRVGTDVAIPSGTLVLGSVTHVDRGGKLKNRSRLGVRFHTLVLADGTRTPIRTEAIYREGDSPGQESSAKIGAAAVGGAILGAIIGGGKGAAIGGAIGGAGGTAAVMASGRNAAALTAGTPVTIRLQEPVTITIER